MKKILRRIGVESLFFNRILDADSTIAQHAPDMVIFDTNGCFPDEVNHLRNLCQAPEQPAAIVLGDAAVIHSFEGPFIPGDRCLPDPLDPERIVAMVKEMTSDQARDKVTENDTLEEDLKGLLNL
ncbi:MAG: hypothetical protein V3S89_08545 [Desulfobacterales bacterium]